MYFRHLNRRARDAVDSCSPFRAITVHARPAFIGILSIGAAEWITCQAFYSSLCTAECEECGDFAGYVYVLTCKRVCFLCFTESPRYLPLRYSHAIRKYGITRNIIESLPRMWSLPGTYSPNVKKVPKRVSLVDSESASHAGIALHGSLEAMEKYVADQTNQKILQYKERLSYAAQYGFGTKMSIPRPPMTEDIFDGKSGNPFRFMAVVRMPWLDRARQELEWGFHCQGCRRKSRPGHPCGHWRQKYVDASFREHLDKMGSIRDGMHCTSL